MRWALVRLRQRFRCSVTQPSRCSVVTWRKRCADIGGDDGVALAVEDAGQDQRAARRDVPRHVGRQLHQRPRQDVGDDQVERRVGREGRMVEAGRGDRLDIGRRAVEAGILPRRPASRPGRCRSPAPGCARASRRRWPAPRCRCRGRARCAAARGAPRGRSFRGSRRWCRDGRCRRQGRPRSRWRCSPMWLSARSCAPCTKKRPARTGFSPSSERATQSISGSVSRSIASSLADRADDAPHLGLGAAEIVRAT